MRSSTLKLALAAAVAGSTVLVPALTPSADAAAPTGSAYAQAVLKDGPSAFLQGLNDVTGKTPNGTVVGGSTATTLPNGDPGLAFNGNGQYAQFSDSKAFEVDNTGVLTAEYWMRPDTLQFSKMEGSGYVYTMGKGTGNQHEWYTRMYSKTNQENRPNRISGYVFNPAGGLGSGSYFQDTVKTGEWIHVALVINANAKSSAYPMGYAKIYKNGVLRDTDSLKDYNITPKSGTAPLRVGTGYLNSFFQGAMGDIAFYNKELTQAQIAAHTKAMGQAGGTSTGTPARPGSAKAGTTAAHRINGTNVKRTGNKLVRYTRAEGRRTHTNARGVEVVVVQGKVVSVRRGTGNTVIPKHGYVLSGTGTSRSWLGSKAKVGTVVRIGHGKVVLTTR